MGWVNKDNSNVFAEGGKVEALDVSRKEKRRKIKDIRTRTKKIIKGAKRLEKENPNVTKKSAREFKKWKRKRKREDIKSIRKVGMSVGEKKITEKRIGHEIISKKEFKKMSKSK